MPAPARHAGQHGGEIDLDAAAWHEQPAHLHRGARRRRREELFPHLVEWGEVAQIGDKHLRLHDVFEVAAGCLQDAANVIQDVARLLLHVGAARHPGAVVRGDLACGIHCFASENALAVVRHRRRCLGAGNHAPRHVWAHGDEVYLDAAAGHQQCAHLHRGARRRRREELLPHLVEVVEVLQVGEKHLRLHHVFQVTARRLEHAPQVVEHVARLLLDVGAVIREGGVLSCLRWHPAAVVRGDLAGGVHRVARHHAVAVMRHRRRHAGRGEDFAFHRARRLIIVREAHKVTAAKQWSAEAIEAALAAQGIRLAPGRGERLAPALDAVLGASAADRLRDALDFESDPAGYALALERCKAK